MSLSCVVAYYECRVRTEQLVCSVPWHVSHPVLEYYVLAWINNDGTVIVLVCDDCVPV